VELVVLELVLWAVCAVHHPTGLAAGCPELLLTRILGGGGDKRDMRYSQY
jgi:hypothetical protein